MQDKVGGVCSVGYVHVRTNETLRWLSLFKSPLRVETRDGRAFDDSSNKTAL